MSDWKDLVKQAREALKDVDWSSKSEVQKLHDRAAVPLEKALVKGPDDPTKCHIKQVLRLYLRQPADGCSWTERLWGSQTGKGCEELELPEASLEFLRWITADAIDYLTAIVDDSEPPAPKRGFICRIDNPLQGIPPLHNFGC